jgi:hypothetical protein
MYACRASTVVPMTTFSEFHKSLQELADSYIKQGLMLKMDSNLDSSIVRIFGENITSLAKATAGLEDVSDLAYTTAEHHPYWSLLYHASQISKMVLEKWNDALTKEELDEVVWLIDELKNTAEKLRAFQTEHDAH